MPHHLTTAQVAASGTWTDPGDVHAWVPGADQTAARPGAPEVAVDPGGAVRVVAVADTHVPARARDLPAGLWDAVDAADLVVHAGDWVTTDLLDRFEERATALLACHGNNDPRALAARVPEVGRAVVAGVRLGVVHETGAATGRERRCDERFGDLDLLVFGHSHIPWDSTTPGGLRLLNPGSPTDRRRQPACTYLTFTLRAGAVEELELHRLPLRPPGPRRRGHEGLRPAVARDGGLVRQLPRLDSNQ